MMELSVASLCRCRERGGGGQVACVQEQGNRVRERTDGWAPPGLKLFQNI
jgi:hypothetical protein